MKKKLVRDLIPEIIDRSGRTSIYYCATDEEYRNLVKMKLLEEVNEFLEAESMEELADVLEVIDAIHVAYQFDIEHVQQVKETKKVERGGFKGKIVLERIDNN
ncbi:MAG: nucleoside triphosphate pyrophosphohydrolase [Parachlamydiaceae bacterium]|nr:nucleoside triphosphate pyrophosphohydrolase [Parachlamydiaceae bacterium]